jgi:hypothetical protein
MALDIYSADSYIETNVIVIEDWTDCDEDKKQRLLNVANSTLSRVYPDYTIPDKRSMNFRLFLQRPTTIQTYRNKTESSSSPSQAFRIHLAKSKRLKR